jgi:hypothetical protein
MSAVRIIDRDNGYKVLFKRLSEPPRVLSVGILAEAGSASHGDKSIIEIAELNEFGSEGGLIPERSFIRAWADEKANENTETLRKIGKAVIAGKVDAATGLEQAGARFTGEIQGRIAGGIAPANAPSTVAKKGSSTPLIEDGILRSSIAHKVE